VKGDVGKTANRLMVGCPANMSEQRSGTATADGGSTPPLRAKLHLNSAMSLLSVKRLYHSGGIRLRALNYYLFRADDATGSLKIRKLESGERPPPFLSHNKLNAFRKWIRPSIWGSRLSAAGT
jgi:hypothetical protein